MTESIGDYTIDIICRCVFIQLVRTALSSVRNTRGLNSRCSSWCNSLLRLRKPHRCHCHSSQIILKDSLSPSLRASRLSADDARIDNSRRYVNQKPIIQQHLVFVYTHCIYYRKQGNNVVQYMFHSTVSPLEHAAT